MLLVPLSVSPPSRAPALAAENKRTNQMWRALYVIPSRRGASTKRRDTYFSIERFNIVKMWKKLFGENAAKNVITVFHKPSAPGSTRVVTFLKQHQANAQNTATEDQAGSHQVPPPTQRADYDLDIQEDAPTGDQLKTILEYAGPGKAGTIVQGARDITDALEKVKRDATLFNRPLVVDWHQGKVTVGDNESEILKLLKAIPETK
ncbi:uncharacterized protein PV09_00218 [Verruconis gallopava]|uniref:Redox protein fmp46, mitochondrial n=1 Tax=Verruconis gallopava TaxID=253628 RepID=A0A0D1Z8G1_9PEZI|nr:uncharacterized protein PV09_00218 [Verruconis gallopava]KIW09302.1 hypothetical protein PV09_00218 [Verruconis gallopava]